MRVILNGKVVQKLRLKLSTSFLDSINAPSAFEHLVHEIQQKFHDVKKKKSRRFAHFCMEHAF